MFLKPFIHSLLAVFVLLGCKEKKEVRNTTETTGTVESVKQVFEAHDKAIHIKKGWIRDPYIYLADDGFYYLTGTTPKQGDPREATEPYNTGLDAQNIELFGKPSIVGPDINLWKSKNLFDWQYVGAPFSLEKGYWVEKHSQKFKEIPEKDWRLWAPEVYKIDGKWVMVHTSPAPVQGGANLALTEGENITGPFTFPMKEDIRRKHDPSLFNDDGQWYLLWGNTSIAPLKPNFSGLAAEPKRIDPSDRVIGHEGATVRKIGDKYVHFGTAWSTDKMRKGSYNLYYSLADNIMGPYGPRRFVGRFLGHGTPFKDKQGRWWCTAFYNGNVPPVSKENIAGQDLGQTAQTINEQGTTIVPLHVEIKSDGDVFIRAKDPDYSNPGPDEAQGFENAVNK